MKILFCEDTFNPNTVEEAYSKEYESAINNGFNGLIKRMLVFCVCKYFKY